MKGGAMTDLILEAILVLFGNEHEWFIFAEVDPVEWTHPKYHHQN